MTFALSSSLFAPAFLDAHIDELLGDASYFRSLLQVEVALARAQARLGLIPAAAAASIESAAARMPLDRAALARGVARDGIPTLALVAELRALVGPDAARFVHLGATSQDIMDSAQVLCFERALAHIDQGLTDLLARLAELARRHRDTLMVARTHGQHALPSRFGLKVTSWALPLVRHRERLVQLRARLAVIQLGGAAGTLAALGPRALELCDAFALELGLGVPELPWHAQRDNIAELGSWLSLVTGSLGKLAQDVIAMCQSEVAELSEAEPGQRGASSSMPHKNNPMLSEQILAAARFVSGQLATLHHAQVQEHERGTHGWQVEWLCVTPMLQLTGGAVSNALLLARGLRVDRARMRENLLSHSGLALSEAAAEALSNLLPQSEARALVTAASEFARAEGRSLIEVLRAELSKVAPEAQVDWARLSDPASHVGQADALIDRALARIDAQVPGITR